MSDPKIAEVGYKKPPVHSRFKPGQSGNPKGRPKNVTVGFEIVGELRRKVLVRENGTEQRISKAAALAKSLVARALAGDMRAVSHLMRLLPAHFQAPTEIADVKLTAEEAEALDDFAVRRSAELQEMSAAKREDQSKNISQKD